MDVDFSNELEDFKNALKEKRELLEELKQKRDAHSKQTRRARQALEDLRAILRGETPPSQRDTVEQVDGISRVPRDEDTKRPPRGARRKQIEEICEKLGAGGEEFRTADVLNILRKVEGDDEGKISPGMRSYTYTLMNTLEDDGFVNRIGRGLWELT